MLHLQFCKDNKVFESISKPTAKKLFEAKKELYWLENLADPNGYWNYPKHIYYTQRHCQSDFNTFYNTIAKICRWHSYKKIGKIPRFYANVKDIQELKGRK